MNSLYRPRLPSVSPGLLSIVMLPIVAVFRSTSSGHQLSIIGVLARSVFCFTGDVMLWRSEPRVRTTVHDCHDASLHLCEIPEQMLLCCQLFLKVRGEHGEKNSQSHVFQVTGPPVRSRWRCSRFFRVWMVFGSFRWRQDLPAVVQTPPSC